MDIKCFFFFFQAEDGIRDVAVTGVQTCALPICAGSVLRRPDRRRDGPLWTRLVYRNTQGGSVARRNAEARCCRRPLTKQPELRAGEPLRVRVCESVVRQAQADALPSQPKRPQLGPGGSFIDEILRTDRHAPGGPMWPLSRSKL